MRRDRLRGPARGASDEHVHDAPRRSRRAPPMTTEAVVTGWGFYVPPKVLTNADLETIVDTTDAWIYERTGIRERHIVEGDEVTSVMATKAAKEALARAGVRGEDLDAIVVATTSPDYLLPTAACLVQESLGARRAAVFDLGAACAGFIYGLAVARGLVLSGTARKILLVGAETISRFLDWNDRATCVLFGAGAGAVVIEATAAGAGIRSTALHGDGTKKAHLRLEGGGSLHPPMGSGFGGCFLLHPDGRSRGVQARRAGDGGRDARSARAGGPAPRGCGPLHPAPGERAHHRRRRQALGSRSLEGLRRHRSIRQHVGG